MLFKGLGLGLFVVLAAVLMLGTVAADYDKFLRQHYNNPKSSLRRKYCDGMMDIRGMAKRPCKDINTFIHTTKNNIIAVCGDGGEAIERGWRRSKKQFQVTTCTIRGSSLDPPCEYRENMSPRNIVIACEDGLPVHYQEGHIFIVSEEGMK